MLSGISLWQLLIILAIVVVLFGTKKLRNMGSDVGNAVKGFKDAVKDGEKDGDKNANKDKPGLDGQQHKEQHKDGATINQPAEKQDQDKS